MSYKSSAKLRKNNIGALTSYIRQNEVDFFASQVAILNTITSKRLYVIAGNPKKHAYGNAYIIALKYEHGTNLLSKITKYILHQIKICYSVYRMRHNVDIWVVFMADDLLLPVLTLKLLGKKVLMVLGGYLEKEILLHKKYFLLPLIIFKKLCLILCDRVIIYSKGIIRSWHLQLYHKKIRIACWHYLDFDKFEQTVPLDERNNIIGYIGRFSKEKGTLNFVETIPKLATMIDNMEFMILGGGPLRPLVEEVIHRQGLSGKINLIGWVDHQDLPSYLNRIKLLVIPSFTEGLPNIILEAMACGTPILATPVGSIPDIIKDEESGFIMNDNSIECIANNVVRALNSPNTLKVIQNAHEFVHKEYTFSEAVRKYKEIIDGLSTRKK